MDDNTDKDPFEAAKRDAIEAADLIPDHMREDVVNEILAALQAADGLAAALLENQDMDAINPTVMVPLITYIGRSLAIRNSIARGIQFLGGKGVDMERLIRRMREEEEKRGKDSY